MHKDIGRGFKIIKYKLKVESLKPQKKTKINHAS